jgi:mTERF domain-containing protein
LRVNNKILTSLVLQEVGVPTTSIGAVIARHPLILSHSVEEMMAPRVHFLRDLGVSKEGVAKMVMKHPQILQYKVESMLPRLQYLQSIGMSEDDIILCVSRLSQVRLSKLSHHSRVHGLIIQRSGNTRR